MPNKKGGKKFKRHAKHKTDTKLIYRDRDDDQEYAQVKRVNGSGRYHLLCFDGQERLGIVAGQIRKRTRLVIGDIVLVSIWTDLQPTKCSIIHKYHYDEARKLQSEGLFPETLQLTEDNPYNPEMPTDIFDYGDDDLPRDLPASASSEEEEEEEDTIDINDI
jgi:initiation factor 1A